MNQQPLVSIREASHLLGVNEATLRQWTDEGKIGAFITPGGHRRYSRAELKRFMRSRHKLVGMRDFVIKLEETVQLHRMIGKTHLSSISWYSRLSQESREQLANLGRSLLSTIVRCVTEPSKVEQTIELAREVGHQFGETLAELGVPLTDSVEAFVLHRDPIMSTITDLMRKREAFSGRVVGAIPLVQRVMDEALVSLVAAHQQHQALSQSESKGGLLS